MWRLSSSVRSTLDDSIRPPEIEINPPKATCGCLCYGVLKSGITRKPLPHRNAFVNAQLHKYFVHIYICINTLSLYNYINTLPIYSCINTLLMYIYINTLSMCNCINTLLMYLYNYINTLSKYNYINTLSNVQLHKYFVNVHVQLHTFFVKVQLHKYFVNVQLHKYFLSMYNCIHILLFSCSVLGLA